MVNSDTCKTDGWFVNIKYSGDTVYERNVLMHTCTHHSNNSGHTWSRNYNLHLNL